MNQPAGRRVYAAGSFGSWTHVKGGDKPSRLDRPVLVFGADLVSEEEDRRLRARVPVLERCLPGGAASAEDLHHC